MKYFIVAAALLSIFSCDLMDKENPNQDNKSSNLSPIERQIELLSQRLIDSPKNAYLYFQRGQLYWQTLENEKALNDFYKMTTFDSTKPVYFEVLAEFFVQNGNIDRGINALDYSIKLDPTNPKYHVLQGKYCLIVKRYQNAIDHLNNALKRDLFNPEAYFYKGLVYRESKNISKAISSLVTATEQDPTWDAPFEILGEIYAEQKNDLCLKYFDNATAANPKNTSARMQKAYYLKETKRVKEAMAIYESLVIESPQNADAMYNLGVLTYDQKDYNKALQQFQMSIKVDPKHALSYYMIGKSQLALGNKPLAINAFQNARNFDTTMTEAVAELNRLK